MALINTKNPRLPAAPLEYNKLFMDQLERVLGLYFNTIDNVTLAVASSGVTDMTYTTTDNNHTLYVGGPSGISTITPYPATAGEGSALGLSGADGTLGFDGGQVNVTGGSGLNGGSIQFQSGLANQTSGNGGNFLLLSGAGLGTGNGGSFQMLAGSNADAGAGGNFILAAGDGATTGGLVQIYGGGSAAGLGGNIELNAGFGVSSVLLKSQTFGAIIEAGDNGTARTIGFYGATATTKPTVTGSRAGNAALASLLTQLATLGLITNSTT